MSSSREKLCTVVNGPDRDERGRVDAFAREDVVRPVAEPLLGERRAGEGRDEEEDDEEAARDRDLVAAEPAPDLLPVAASLDVGDLAELAAGLERDLGGETCAGRENFASVLLRHGLRENNAGRTVRPR